MQWRVGSPEQAPRIMLVCAPAGYGKTTLVASWAAGSSVPVAWLSLDGGDNDPLRFLMHVIHAVGGQDAEFGKVMVDLFASTPPMPIDARMRSMVNQLCELPQRLCLILDDLQDATQAFDPLPLLFSKKEKLVVSHIARGATKHEIAEQLFISPNTLNSHVKKIYAKLGVNSRLQAAERLRQLGLPA
jgi:ATP/maltotriose-dependent transcriptional regulator MalT